MLQIRRPSVRYHPGGDHPVVIPIALTATATSWRWLAEMPIDHPRIMELLIECCGLWEMGFDLVRQTVDLQDEAGNWLQFTYREWQALCAEIADRYWGTGQKTDSDEESSVGEKTDADEEDSVGVMDPDEMDAEDPEAALRDLREAEEQYPVGSRHRRREVIAHAMDTSQEATIVYRFDEEPDVVQVVPVYFWKRLLRLEEELAGELSEE